MRFLKNVLSPKRKGEGLDYITTYKKAHKNFILSLDEHFELYDGLIRITTYKSTLNC